MRKGSEEKCFVKYGQDQEKFITNLISDNAKKYCNSPNIFVESLPINSKHLLDNVKSYACTLYEYIKMDTLYAMAQRRNMITSLRNALKFLYNNQLIHCDIKQENIFVNVESSPVQFVLGNFDLCVTINRALEGLATFHCDPRDYISVYHIPRKMFDP